MLRKQLYHFARNKVKNNIDFDEVQMFKARRLSILQHKYHFQDLFKHEDKLFEEDLHGHKCHVSSVTEKSFSSTEFTKQVVNHIKPTTIILGGLNDSALIDGEDRSKYSKEPMYKVEKMYCKERIVKYLQNKSENDINFFYDEISKNVYLINQQQLRIYPNDYYNAAFQSMTLQKCKVMFGKPSDVIIMEDLMLNCTLQELKQILERTTQKVLTRLPKQMKWRKNFIDQTIKAYAMAEEPTLYSYPISLSRKQLTFTTALLHRISKIDHKTLLLIPGYFTERIAENVHKITIDPNHVYRNYLQSPESQSLQKLQTILKQNNPRELIKKLVILSILKESQSLNYLEGWQNFFLKSIFEPLFRELVHSEQFQKMIAVEFALYNSDILTIKRKRIENVLDRERASKYMKLQDQLALIDERKVDFPYSYEAKNRITVMQEAVKMENLHNKMKELLNEEGDQEQIELFQNFIKGQASKEGIILYSKLIGRANVQLHDKVKLPVYHYGAFRGIYKDYLKDFLTDSKEEKQFKKTYTQVEKKMKEMSKRIDDPLEIQRILTGEMGKVKSFDIYDEDLKGNVDIQELIEKEIVDLTQALAKFDEKDDSEAQTYEEFLKEEQRK